MRGEGDIDGMVTEWWFEILWIVVSAGLCAVIYETDLVSERGGCQDGHVAPDTNEDTHG